MRVRTDDGQEIELGPGDAHVIGAGHDAWVVGEESCVALDFSSTGELFGGRVGRCPCGVEFRIATDDQLDHLIAAMQEHARGSHTHTLTRADILTNIGVTQP